MRLTTFSRDGLMAGVCAGRFACFSRWRRWRLQPIELRHRKAGRARALGKARLLIDGQEQGDGQRVAKFPLAPENSLSQSIASENPRKLEILGPVRARASWGLY
jgi:hypothetical protein